MNTGPRGTMDPLEVKQLELERLNRELARREAQLRAIIETEPECVKLLGADGALLDMNPAGLRLIEADSLDQVRNHCIYPLVTGEYRAAFQALTEQVFRGETGTLEFQITGLKGGGRWLETHAAPLRDENGDITALLGITRDISDRKRAEQALAEQEFQFRTLANAGLALMWTASTGKSRNYFNDPWLKFTGRTLKQESGHGWAEGLHPEDLDACRKIYNAAFDKREPFDMIYRLRHVSGAYRYIRDLGTPNYNSGGEFLGYIGHCFDISEQRQAEETIKRSEQEFRLLFKNNPMPMWVYDLKTLRFLAVNQAAVEHYGYSRDEFLTMTIRDIRPVEDVPALLTAVGRNPAGLDFAGVWRHRKKDGAIVLVEITSHAMDFQGYKAELVLAHDVTARKEAEQALRESQERLDGILNSLDDVVWSADCDGAQMLYLNPAAEKIYGRTVAEFFARPKLWQEVVHPEDAAAVGAAFENFHRDGAFLAEYRILRPNGTVRWLRDRGHLVKDPAGRPLRFDGIATDITERKQAEAALRESEERLRQSQKMEAIGQLAGGVAHDFNNILAAMTMEAELSLMVENLPAEVADGLKQIGVCAQRAANLTRQLLLFSRREVLQMSDLDLNEVVTQLSKMLQRIIGEDVRLDLQFHPAALTARADPGMLDQLLLNLSVNARDAMPEGGRLLIETSEQTVDAQAARAHPDARPGHFVCLKVSDTGCGIAPEVLPRIFEPFFTTKAPGKGTGLGLATVFGIVKQHQGWIQVSSATGQGATFRIFLPASGAARSAAGVAANPAHRRGTETILLVEDDEQVRRLSRMVLERNGYTVLEAADGLDALDLWRDHQDTVALLLTDQVMPGGLSGLELARRFQADQPRLRVVIASGYSTDFAGRELQLRPGEYFLHKPFRTKQLLEIVRRGLDS